MAVEGDGDVFDLVVWIALGNGICALAFGAAHHVADAGDGFAHVFGFVGHGNYLAAVAGGVAKADDTFAVLSDGHRLLLMSKARSRRRGNAQSALFPAGFSSDFRHFFGHAEFFFGWDVNFRPSEWCIAWHDFGV